MTAGLGNTHLTTTSNTQYLPALVAKEVQVAAEANLVFAKLVTRFDREVVDYGASVRIPHLSHGSATAKTAETAVTFNSTVESATTLTINKHYECSYLLEDILGAQSKADLMPLYLKEAGYALAVQIDTDLATLVASMSQTVGDYATATLADADILRSIQYLDDANAPEADRSFIMKPALRAAMLGLDKFVRMDATGEKSIVSGHIGQIYGLKCHVSTNVYASGSNLANVIMHKEALALAMQKEIKVETGRIIEYLGTAIIGQTLYGVSAYRSTFGVLVKA